jgi:hypothetical protein
LLLTILITLIFPVCTIGYGGRKVVLYGGHEWVLGAEELRGMIYVLDVPTMTWTAGELVNPNFVSADSACTITGSNFISWGGTVFTNPSPPVFSSLVLPDY